VQDNDLKIDVELLLLLTYLMSKQQLKSYQDAAISENGNIYFWFAPKKTILDLPILVQNCKNDRAKLDKIRSLYKNLIEGGFMVAYEKNQEIAMAYYSFTEKASLTLTEKPVTPYEENRKPLTENSVSSSILESNIINSNILLSIGEETPPTNESDITSFNALENEYDGVPFSGDGMVDFLKWQMEKEKLETLNAKKETKEKKVAPKKEKKEKIDNRKYLVEVFPNEESFAVAWGFKYGAKYPNIDPSKAYAKLEYWSENKRAVGNVEGKKADWLCTAKVWYEKEETPAKRATWEITQTVKSKMQAAHDRLFGNQNYDNF